MFLFPFYFPLAWALLTVLSLATANLYRLDGDLDAEQKEKKRQDVIVWETFFLMFQIFFCNCWIAFHFEGEWVVFIFTIIFCLNMALISSYPEYRDKIVSKIQSWLQGK